MKPATPCPANRLNSALRRLRETRVTETCGRVVQVIGLVIESEGPIASVGEVCRIQSAHKDGTTLAEVVGFRNNHLLLMPLGELHGIHPGSEVVATGSPMRVPVGPALQGRVLDGLGNPLDRLGPVFCEHTVGLNFPPPHPLKRQRIKNVFQTGIRAIDTFTPCGRGQRLGIFAGSGHRA
jgi:flagellum-specific ATP synthase